MYGLLGGDGQTGPRKRPIETSAVQGSVPVSYKTTEGQAARKLVPLLDKMSFDVPGFVYTLAHEAGPGLKRRLLDVAIGIIKHYANDWDYGNYDDVSRDAKRLKDTLDQFKM